MKKYFLKDYCLFVTAKVLGWFFMFLPMNVALNLAKVIGTLGYYLDFKHKKIVYANIKIAFGNTKSLEEINTIVKKTFQSFCQHIVEVLCLPKITHGYIEKYVQFEDKSVITDAINQKQGVIVSSMHFGSWELSFILCDRLGPPFRIIAREHEKFSKTDRLLNSYRQLRPESVLYRSSSPREMVKVIQNKEILGLVLDQGGREGQLVEFFGKNASMPTGALRLALKFSVPMVMVFIIRQKGPFHKIILKRLKLEETGETEKDIETNLKKIMELAEGIIRQYPEQYMWFYKVWKYSDQRKVVILNDGKIGQLRQSQAVAEILANELEKRNLKPKIETMDVRFKNKFSKVMIALCSVPAAKRHCQGCLWCLKKFLKGSSYENLSRIKADFIISSGSALANVNYILSNDSLAKSISILRPNLLSTNRFDLVIMPKHDSPPDKENVVITEGSLNLINEDYLKQQSKEIILRYPNLNQSRTKTIGILLGGNTKNYKISYETVKILISELKNISESLDLQILLTTSRRTPASVENLIREDLKSFSKCRLLIIANENNIPEAVGGILGLSDMIIVSDDSISMVSEAATSGKYVIVVKTGEESSSRNKHRRFLESLSREEYIFLVKPNNISDTIRQVFNNRPKVKKLDDSEAVASAIRKIL